MTLLPSLRPPRLHGRQESLEVLQATLNRAGRSGLQLLLISGEAGVGKTTLVEELRPAVEQAQGCYALGKCEHFRSDSVLRAPRQALQQLLIELLSRPEHQLAPLRRDLRHGLGADAAALLPLLPELETLLGALPPARPLELQERSVRLRALLLTLLQQLLQHVQPLVLVLDDLHWADQPTLDLMTALLEAQGLAGLVLIGLHRPVPRSHRSALGRWLRKAAECMQPPLLLQLRNLPVAELTALVADMLDSQPEQVQELAASVHRSSDGNPFFARELIRALHREGLLDSAPGGWRWDGARISRRVSGAAVEEVLLAQLGQLPPASRDLLVTLAWLGSRTTLAMLAEVTAEAPPRLLTLLEPALQQGVLSSHSLADLRDGDPQADVGFSHDRLLQAAAELRDPAWRLRTQLAIARRLVGGRHRLDAADHYARAATLLDQDAEKLQVAELLLDAGRSALSAGGFETAGRQLQVAFDLLGQEPWRDSADLAWQLQVALHQASYCLADYARADALYAGLQERAVRPESLLAPACIQVMSLSNRCRYGEAVQLSLELLRRLGIAVPAVDLQSELGRELEAFVASVDRGALERLPAIQPESPDASVVRLMNRLVPAAFFWDPPLACWLVLRSVNGWIGGDHNPARLYPMACTLLATVACRDDYRSGWRAARAALSAAEAGEAGIETARTRHVYALFNSHWCEPLEQGLSQARRAHDELLHGGELEFACYTYYTSQAALLDTAPSLAALAEENRLALAFSRRTGNRHAEPAYAAFSRLIADLSNSTLIEPDGDQAPEPATTNPMAACYSHVLHALAACLLGDGEALQRHAAAAVSLEPYITGFYPVVWIRLLEAFALLARCSGGDAEPGRTDRLEALQTWLAARAEDSPQNFSHLLDLLRAERLVAAQRWQEALPLYEAAIRGAMAHQRPWHAALATERAARAYLALDLEQAGQRLLEQAHQRYGAWGAGRKQRLLEEEFPFLRGVSTPLPEGATLLEAIQRLGALRTTAELAQTSAELIGRLSGATDVQIIVLNSDQVWELAGSFGTDRPLPRQSLTTAAAAGLVAESALRLALQQLLPVISHDAVRDGRFQGDPHLRDLAVCSLLAVPVLVQNRPLAVAIVEHHGMRGVFAPALAQAVQLICGQLAVALENSLIQRSLQQQVEQRSAELRAAYEREARNEEQRRRLLEQKLKTSLTAAAVVHEIQQPLSAILLNCRLASRSLENQPVEKLPAALIASLAQLSRDGDQVVATMERIRMLLRNVETEHGPVDLCASVDSALLFLKRDLARQGIEPQLLGFEQSCQIRGDGAQLQIALVNLIRNALQAMQAQPPASRSLCLELCRRADRLELLVADSGPGFPQGFSGETSWELLQSTKATGMGIGLFLAETAATNHRGQLCLGRSASLGGAEVRLILPLS